MLKEKVEQALKGIKGIELVEATYSDGSKAVTIIPSNLYSAYEDCGFYNQEYDLYSIEINNANQLDSYSRNKVLNMLKAYENSLFALYAENKDNKLMFELTTLENDMHVLRIEEIYLLFDEDLQQVAVYLLDEYGNICDYTTVPHFDYTVNNDVERFGNWR